jgi:hypothetical protein
MIRTSARVEGMDRPCETYTSILSTSVKEHKDIMEKRCQSASRQRFDKLFYVEIESKKPSLAAGERLVGLLTTIKKHYIA